MTCIDEDKWVNDFLHDIEDNDNGYEDDAIIFADIHTNACTYIIYNEHNYTCRTHFLWFSLSSFIHTNNI